MSFKNIIGVCCFLCIAACGPAAKDASGDGNSSSTGQTAQSGGSATDITWEKSVVELGLRGQNDLVVAYSCSPGGEFGTVWGTDVYTDDSSICTAGVHAGKITRENGGVVIVRVKPGQSAYVGTTRNGVTSSDYGEWIGSFVFENP